MNEEEKFKHIPKEGFIKFSFDDSIKIKNQEEKVVLIRKGNELFNKKEYDLAKRIFITTKYADGLIRLGDYYYGLKKPIEALRMYWLAQDKKRSGVLIEKIVKILRSCLQERIQETDGKNRE